MAVKEIVQIGTKCLWEVCDEVVDFDESLHELLQDLHDTLDNSTGVGLAAPQIGVTRRVFVAFNIDDNLAPMEFINPVITKVEGSVEGPEGCLSYVGNYGLVNRPTYINVEYQDRFGEKESIEFNGVMAKVMQHEIEHLDGHLYTEKVIRYLTAEEIEEMKNSRESSKNS